MAGGDSEGSDARDGGGRVLTGGVGCLLGRRTAHAVATAVLSLHGWLPRSAAAASIVRRSVVTW